MYGSDRLCVNEFIIMGIGGRRKEEDRRERLLKSIRYIVPLEAANELATEIGQLW